jgi:hypothetical protein
MILINIDWPCEDAGDDPLRFSLNGPFGGSIDNQHNNANKPTRFGIE